jgi:REP element-mobilizing transposase RayT
VLASHLGVLLFHRALSLFFFLSPSLHLNTRAADNGELWGWAFFRARRVPNAAETYVFESMRWPGCYLVAAEMGTGYLSKSHGVVKLAQVKYYIRETWHLRIGA